MAFGDILKTLRENKNISQSDLAKEIKVTSRSVINWEQGASIPNSSTLIKIANYFGTTVDFLLDEKEDFLMQAENEYGVRGKSQAQEILKITKGLFDGGVLKPEDQDDFFKTMTEIYWDAKEQNKKYCNNK